MGRSSDTAGAALPHPRTGRLFTSPVRPGSGWPGDPATARTAVAAEPAEVAELAASTRTVAQLDARVSVCRACPRLVTWREDVAVGKRKAYADEPYWGRPATGLGPARPSVWVLGLAPAAHGANRTGRVFTGDRSGDFLFASLYRSGLANQPTAADSADGLTLNDVRVVAAVRCAPPANAPEPAERATCAPWLDAEWRLTGASAQVIVALGGFAWQSALALIRRVGGVVPTPVPRFGHGALTTVTVPGRSGREVRELSLLGCFHPSQQNTFTGRLTPAMMDDIFATALRIGRAK
ncbi:MULTISPECIES: uracil-DNA glycosylase [Mycobacteriaceae]|uniref:Uracil-DNA glycosylase n=1 Tax=Mycolicibacterium parafortuitum TaxID=39692 RepID=A0ACC6MD54_MYCPF|nr:MULTISPECIES: uracil-DNA glycosylase [Mycobacteriaceae]MDZ5084787.1 uracil-DNA glycosylase [Mycolicibacterium parafortuitum]GFM22335.1 uracil-DNA glycosylase superfamily protein [Mycobacterium sp. PO2]